MVLIDKTYHKIYYCPTKENRKVDDTNGLEDYKPTKKLVWTKQELEFGKVVKVHKFPGSYKHKIFRVNISTDKTELIIKLD